MLLLFFLFHHSTSFHNACPNGIGAVYVIAVDQDKETRLMPSLGESHTFYTKKSGCQGSRKKDTVLC
ncbi:hypothetical protein [Sporomusa rhizae]|uniref:hypothetical protein n=1 Tax=Sporomusa rhizae TaxID=357999 RepID=UPI00352B118B